MRAPVQRVMTAITTAVVTLSLAVSAAGLAQDPTDEPAATPSPFCGVLTAEEASTALGVTLTVGTSSETDCSYDSDFETTDVSLNVRREPGPLNDDYPRSYYPDGVDVQAGGHAAWYDADSTILFVDEGSLDQLFVLQLFGTAPDQIDLQAALTSLAEAGLPRLAAIPIPAEPTQEPEPSYFGDSELAALVPTVIGESPVDIQTKSGADILAGTDPDDPDAQEGLRSLQDALAAMGKSLDDLSLVDATFPTEEAFGDITGIRLKGTDISSVTDDLLPLLLSDIADPQQTPMVIGGKDIIVISDGPLEAASLDPSASLDPYAVEPVRIYMYPKGEVLWFVSVDEPALTEVFQKLP